jgi:hypothetical protein
MMLQKHIEAPNRQLRCLQRSLQRAQAALTSVSLLLTLGLQVLKWNRHGFAVSAEWQNGYVAKQY